MQKRKNLQLIIILSVLIVLTLATWFLLQQEELTVTDPAIFSVEDVSRIDSVGIKKNDHDITIHYKNGEWVINNKYEADEQKITILFAVMNQVRAKRPVGEKESEKIDSLFNAEGVKVTLYEGSEKVQEFEVAGVEERGVSYFRTGKETYLVNIPGYRSYLASLFLMEPQQWRSKLIFNDVSWGNLERVEIRFPEKDGFVIKPEENYFKVEGISSTDSLKLLEYLDRVSLLTADDFIDIDNLNKDSILNQKPIITIAISDIRNRPFDLNIYRSDKYNKDFIAVKDSTDWMLVNKNKINPLLREKRYFIK